MKVWVISVAVPAAELDFASDLRSELEDRFESEGRNAYVSLAMTSVEQEPDASAAEAEAPK